jgi:hypothetical protein
VSVFDDTDISAFLEDADKDIEASLLKDRREMVFFVVRFATGGAITSYPERIFEDDPENDPDLRGNDVVGVVIVEPEARHGAPEVPKSRTDAYRKAIEEGRI